MFFDDDQFGQSAPAYQEIPSAMRKEQEEDEAKKFDIQKIIHGLNRHLGLIVLSTLLCGALGAWAAWYYTHNYRAEAVVVYQEDLPKTIPGGIALTNLSLATAVDLITLPTNFQAVKAVLGLDMSAKEIENSVQVPTPKLNSHLIRVITKSDNPHLAADISNTLAKIAVKNSQDFQQRQLQAQLDNFKEQLNQALQRMAVEQKEIEEFKTKHQYFEMTADYTTLLSELVTLRSKLQTASLNYNSLLVEYENLKSEQGKLDYGLDARNTYVDPLQTRINSLESSLAEARSKYAPANPKIKIMEEELKTLLEKAKQSSEKGDRLSPDMVKLQGKVRSSQKVKQDLTMAVAKLEKDLETLPSEQGAFSKLLQNNKITQDEVQFLHQSIDTIQLMINVPKGNLELYQLADKPKPLKDSLIIPLLPLLGLGLGLLVGLISAAGMELKDPHLWTRKQIELLYTIPALAQIPILHNLTKENSFDKLLFFVRVVAEKLDRLAALLPFKDNNKHWILTIASPKAGDGKSLLARELALYYQRIGKKVLLLEIDPYPAPFSEKTPPVSLGDFFESQGDWRSLVSHGNLDTIKGWSDDPYMKEIVKSEAMRNFIEDLRKAYDLVIIDAPGLIDEHYTANLAALSDLCLFVIGSPNSTKDLVNESLLELEHAGVVPCGIVLNKVLPVYIDDTRIKKALNRIEKSWWQRLWGS